MSKLSVKRSWLPIFTFALLAGFPLIAFDRSQAQPPRTVARSGVGRARTPLPSTLPLPPSVDPFAAVAGEAAAGNTRQLKFTRTKLDARAVATAEVALIGQTLLVRMRAKNMPVPARFGVPRYALWVYVPNYQTKYYIGDLPLTPTSRTRGHSDSAFRYTVLPPGAEFGGLMLTAEPIRYTPIVNEALRPLLVVLIDKNQLAAAAAATTVYATATDDDPNTTEGGPDAAAPAATAVTPVATPPKRRPAKRRPVRRQATKSRRAGTAKRP
ncbi:MAG: hypothetical protein ACRD9R_05630 [Pyrinomonadaceae bacterium]